MDSARMSLLEIGKRWAGAAAVQLVTAGQALAGQRTLMALQVWVLHSVCRGAMVSLKTRSVKDETARIR
jgi:hypothetical protein